MRNREKRNEYMKKYMAQKRKHEKADPNEDFHYHGKDVIAEREELRAREIRAKDEQRKLEFQSKKDKSKPKLSFEQRLALFEKNQKDVGCEFDSQGNVIGEVKDPFSEPQFEQDRIPKDCLGANAWGNTDFWHNSSGSEIKPKSIQDRMKEVFGDHSE